MRQGRRHGDSKEEIRKTQIHPQNKEEGGCENKDPRQTRGKIQARPQRPHAKTPEQGETRGEASRQSARAGRGQSSGPKTGNPSAESRARGTGPAARRHGKTAGAPPGRDASPPVLTKPAAPPASKKLPFKINEIVVYPAHGVGRIVQIEEQEIAGAKLELYIIDFDKEKLRLKVPTSKSELKGMRKLADKSLIEQAMRVLKGRARVKRTMWSRRAQEYEAKINSGDLIAVAEVVRDLYRSEKQPEQSYSERQLFEQALERMAREIAAVKRIDDDVAVKEVQTFLEKNAHRNLKAEEGAVPAEAAA